MRSIAVLLMRLVVGLLLAGHGAQKLFGWFGGRGVEGTAEWLEGLDLQPAGPWAVAAGASEFAGGTLTATGFLNPLGPVAGMAAMAMAYAKVHRDRPIWSTAGGGELPLTNTAVLAAVALAGPGRLSLDGLLGTGMSRRGSAAILAAAVAGIWLGASTELRAQADELRAGADELRAQADELRAGADEVATPNDTTPVSEPAGV